MVEVKADALEQSFEAFEDDGVAAPPGAPWHAL